MLRIPLRDGWWIKEAPRQGGLDAIFGESPAQAGGWVFAGAPVGVQEALFEAGLLDRSVLEDGRAAACAWVAERDWIYRCRFDRPAAEGEVHIDFKGIDTVADIFLNGRLIARHSSMFLPARAAVTESLRDRNDLLLHFHSPYKVLREITDGMPDEHKGKIPPGAYLRKAPGDFNSHGGAVPFFTPIGLFGDVAVVVGETAEILDADVEVELDAGFAAGRVAVALLCRCPRGGGGLVARAELHDSRGAFVAEASGGQ